MGTGRGIADITPLTLLDFPNKVACIFWLRGCNLFCQYCYNGSLVRGTDSPAGDRTDYLDFLRDRVGFLDGVVLSGGECTLCPDLIPICRNIRQLGFAVKIDTNGTRPGVVKTLVEEGLCNYIALDYKAPEKLFGSITGRPDLFPCFTQTLDYLINRNFPFEVRTTIHSGLLGEKEINQISGDLTSRGYRGTYYLQNFFNTEETLGQIGAPERMIDLSLLNTHIPIGLRNFPITEKAPGSSSGKRQPSPLT
ncbi:MAG TPA: anaerobic ribonucleoside-triphosphate reductase activating protein [Akkermansia muciniphila]|nr:anaerobic ribonucleoside-triphosphate reductase activating protein [Akkermansia muciniphila]